MNENENHNFAKALGDPVLVKVTPMNSNKELDINPLEDQEMDEVGEELETKTQSAQKKEKRKIDKQEM